jgi:LEA14-like dessication related protein
MSMRALLGACLAACLSVLLLACEKPSPPKLTPVSGRVTSVSITGIGLEVVLDAHNPNGIAITTRSMTGKITLDGKYHVGDVTTATTVKLPANKSTRLTIPMTVQWKDIGSVVALAASNRNVPYRIDGTVAIGGESINFDVPFVIDGVVTHAELVQATANSIPKIPGIPGLPVLP